MLIAGISTLALSCTPKATSAATTTTQVLTVGRGNLNLSITTVGNLALSQKEELAFEIPGTVEEVLVKTGESVKIGQVLVTLDTTQWDTQVTALQRAVTTAGRKVTSTQMALRNAQNAMVTANNSVTSKQFAARSAQLSLQSANDTLNQINDVKKIRDVIDAAQLTLDIATITIGKPVNVDNYNYWNNVVRDTQLALAQANADMKALVGGTNPTTTSAVALSVAKALLAIDQAQFGITTAELDLQSAQLAVADAQNAIAPAQEDVQNAQDDLKTAQKNLSDAKSNSPEVKAPFAGFITSVSVKGGDDVKKGTVAVTIADPTKFQADVLVNETDISKVKMGGTATVALQSISGSSLSANVTNIAPTATIQQGVVNYKVTVELQSLQPASQSSRQSSSNLTSVNVSPGIPSGGVRQGPGSGNLTQEQISQAIQQRQQALGGQGGRVGNPASGNVSPGTPFGGGRPILGGGNLTQEQFNQAIQQRQQALGGQGGRGGQVTGSANQSQTVQPRQPAAGSANQSQTVQSRQQSAGSANLTQAIQQRQQAAGQFSRQSQAAATSAANLKLAEGMTVTVSILVDSRTNIVLAPSASVSTKGGQSSVKVLKADGTTEDRVIQTGITDRQNTEVISGLTEGEKVQVTRTTTTPGTATNQQPTTRVAIPGVGGLGGGGVFGR